MSLAIVYAFVRTMLELAVISMLAAGSMIALGADSISVSETIAVETVFAKENQERELMGVVYFRSENGVAELSEVPFENENSKTLGNVK
ncbi:hypothetical protein D7X87_10560 [bacterium D16-54]|nr:hypothetical protein D7X87_10560 [bacterium D16-54]RKJ14595.1 hypothetical protein D7X65_11155 [bacterium D16-56]